MKLKQLSKSSIRNKRVLFRVDYDTPMKTLGDKTIIADDTRIRLTLPTLRFLLENQAKVIIIAKRGRPDGKVVSSLRLNPIAKHLEKLINRPVKKLNHIVGPEVSKAVNQMSPSNIIMLENTRFHPGESKNDCSFSKSIASFGEVIVNDAFPLCHRSHASVSGVARYLPMVAGFYLKKEVDMLSNLMENPHRPFVAIVGGAKISDKIDAIHNLTQIADVVLVGGGVANNFLKAEGLEVYSSYLQDIVADEKMRNKNFVRVAKKLLLSTKQDKMLLYGFIPLPKILYPTDVIAADRLKKPKRIKHINLTNHKPNGIKKKNWTYLDIGPKTQKLYREIILEAATVFWNGPMGVFESNSFKSGTKSIATAIAKMKGTSILGGGDTLRAVNDLSLTDRYDYISAAGGAALAFLAGKKLPGLEPLIIS